MMRVFDSVKTISGFLAFFSTVSFGLPQVTITGVEDGQAYARPVEFTVENVPGFAYSAWLSGKAVPVGSRVRVAEPDFYELLIWKTNAATLQITNHSLRFIVHPPERNSTEIGLPLWTPYDDIPSAPGELMGAQLQVMVPRSFPLEFPIPVIARLEDPSGRRLPVNGTITCDASSIAVRRGVGSGFIEPSPALGIHEYEFAFGTNRVAVEIASESEVGWIQIAGTFAANASWPAGSRILVMGNLTNSPGNVISIGAGSVIRVATGANIYNSGHIIVAGSVDRPSVFMSANRGELWGGFVQHASNASLVATGTIFTGSGAEPCWFNGHGCSSSTSGLGSHRGEQALVSLKGANCNITLTDCAAVWLAGQLGHSAGGSGHSYRIEFTRFLMQRATTGGEYTDASFTVNDSAFIECPEASPQFIDGDNDALYLVNGVHGFTNTLFGWTKDDGIDSGASGTGTFNYNNCWFESIFHEANSLSGNRKQVTHYRSVFINCGQGLEAGYDSPSGTMIECLALGNAVGARFGDNYDWSYNGFLRVTNSVLLHNHHDVWGMTWNNWTYATNRMDVRDNYLTQPDPWWPGNHVWDPVANAGILAGFLPTGSSETVGVGISLRGVSPQGPNMLREVAVRLSRFSLVPVSVEYEFRSPGSKVASGTLTFAAGETVKHLRMVSVPTNQFTWLQLKNPVNGALSGESQLIATPVDPGVALNYAGFADQLLLYWRTDALLEEAAALEGPWMLSPRGNPRAVSITSSTKFFRLRPRTSRIQGEGGLF